jgi:hypothetical protein
MHMHSENGSVAMMSSMETRARRRAQQPGPSGSAEREKEKKQTVKNGENNQG